MGRISRERETVRKMIQLYCRENHESNIILCNSCNDLYAYSDHRLIHCQFGSKKPACSKCPVHCYSKSRRENIKEVMRYAGPRMIYKHPYLAVMHIVDKIKSRNNE